MADKAANEDEAEGAGPGESFLDQFLRRLDQTSDQETGAALSTSGSMTLASSSSEYSSNNPWSFMSPAILNADVQPQNLLYPGGSSVPVAPFSANPLAEFPWLLQEFDHPKAVLESRLPGGPDTDSLDSAQRLYSSYSVQEQLHGSSSSHYFQQRGQFPVRDGNDPITVGHGSGSSISKLDAGPVPRFERAPSSEELRPLSSSEHFSDPGSQMIGSRQVNHRPPTSPLLSDATAVGAGGSVTTSAGTSNTSVSSGPSTSNAGDEVESTGKEGATSSGKRKKPEAAAGGSGEEGGGTVGAASETPDQSKKFDPPKSKTRKRGVAKRLREPRYAIKTRTDVDVLDDGFKWRKYGQKAVKNSPHPRNYYRCTTPSCPVRKRVERSNEDAGLVITTYEGTHTHQTPGFHRQTAGGYFGDRPLGMGGGLFQSPLSGLGPGGANLLPLPPGFDLESLQQANTLRDFRGLQQPNPSFPQQQQQQQQQQQLRQLGFPQDSLFRAQQFLGLQDPAFGSVKQEPFQFSAQQAETFMSRIPRQFPDLQPGPSHLLTRSSLSELPLQRPGPLFTGLPAFPNLPPGVPISGPASSSSNITSREPDTRAGPGTGRHEILSVASGSSRIDESLETLVSSSSGRPIFEDTSGQPQPAGRSMSSSSQSIILGSGSQDPRGQPRTPVPQLQQQQQQQQHHRSTRSGLAGGLISSSETLHGQILESSSTLGQQQQQQPAEGLLQDMVRPGGPKVSKS